MYLLAAILEINVFDLEKSLEFYKDALNLTPVREKKAPDGSFRLVPAVTTF